jgi:4-hydroxy-4-methyl-2-oxoglutarate aldolase
MAALAADVKSALLELGVATVYEANGAVGALDPGIHPLWHGAKLCGPAYTVKCAPGDNLALHLSLEHVGEGEVIVAWNGGLAGGYWGGIMTYAAQVRGCTGLLIDGGIRDTEELEKVGFPAFARGTGVFRTYKHEKGEEQVPIIVGGVEVKPGDIILGDADGAMVIPAARVQEYIANGRKRADAEAGIMERLKAGETTVQIYGFLK